MIDWKPMATAPRNGREILVCYDPLEPHASSFASFDVVSWADWANDDQGGWWNGDVTLAADEFTHWAELVAPSGWHSEVHALSKNGQRK